MTHEGADKVVGEEKGGDGSQDWVSLFAEFVHV